MDQLRSKWRRALQVTLHLSALLLVWLGTFMLAGWWVAAALKEQDAWVKIAAGATQGIVLAQVLRIWVLKPWLDRLFPRKAARVELPYD